LKILIRFEGEKNSVCCLLLDAVTSVSDFAGSDCWMVLVFCLVLIRFCRGKKKTKICFGTVGLLLHVAREGVLLCGSLKIWVFQVNLGLYKLFSF
jgi:hypothetical protein